MTVGLSVDDEELKRLAKRVQAVLEVAKKPQMVLFQLAQGVVDQTVARIEYEKTAPDGTRWAPWSPRYAATRDPGDSLLIDSRDLVDSIESRVAGKSFAVWTEIEYAGPLQFGTSRMPARPFLGVSRENQEAIESWLETILLNAVKGAKVKQTTRGKRTSSPKGKKKKR